VTAPEPAGRRGPPPTPAWAERLVAWVARHHRAILLATLLLTLASSLSVLRLRLDVDLVSMLPKGRERFADYERYVSRFGAQDLGVALVRAPDAAAATRFADAFASDLAARPEVLDVRSRIDLAGFASALRGGALPRLLPLESYPEVEKRLAPDAVGEAVRAVRRVLSAPGAVGISERIADDPLGLSRILADALAATRPDRALAPGSEYVLSPDGRRLLVLFRPVAPGYDAEAIPALEAALAAAEAGARAVSGAGPEVEVAYTGAFAYGREDAGLLRDDMSLYSLAAFLGVIAIFHAGYRSLRILPLVAAQMIATTLITFALGLLVQGRLNAVSLAFTAIFFGLSIDTAIHFYTRFREELAARAGLEAALAATIAGLAMPTAIASTTTAAVFVVIGFSALAGVAQLGFLTALGMLLNLPATFVVMPAMLLWRRTGEKHAGGSAPHPTPRLAAIAAFAARDRRLVRTAALATCAAAALVARHERLDVDLFHLRPARSEAGAVQREITESFGMADPDAVVLVSAALPPGAAAQGDAALARDEAVLQASERVRDALLRYEEEGLVRQIVSPSPLMPSEATQRARLAAWRALPREAAAQELEARLRQAGFRVEAFAPALASLRAVPEPVDATLEPLPGLEMLFDRHLQRGARDVGVVTQFAPTGPDALEAVAQRLPRDVAAPAGVAVAVTGRPLMEAELRRTMHGEIAWFLAIALASNAFLIWLQERRWSSTAAILAVPGGCVVALVALAELIDLPLNPVNLIVLPLTIGMGVDHCVYLAARARETGDVVRGVARCGRALAVTAATTVLGFGVLGFSRYPALSHLGMLGALAMALCFATAIAVLPALLPRRAAAR
jgi:predicted RND superfamily exporter protein